MTPDEILAALQAEFGDALTDAGAKGSEAWATTTAAASRAVCRRLKALGFEYLNCLSGVDWLTHLEVVYELSSLVRPARIRLRVTVDRGEPVVPTVSDLWRAADWHERECYDLFGVRFDGHPDHRRILLPEDWTGYPLRKDYADERLVPYTEYGAEKKGARAEAPPGAPAAPEGTAA
ncbi:MAG: NADH-quinone oxidoreductase subunit C [Candidatus Methylomirabilota bacterium]